MNKKTDHTLMLLGGAALGAVAMYLLDPESGANRRHTIAEKSGDAASRTGSTLAPAWERIAETARTVGASIAGGASTFGHGVAEKAGDLRDSVPSGHHMADRLSQIRDSVTEKLHDAGERARSAASTPANWFQREEPSHAGAYAATGLGTAVLGAGLMYFLDPSRGKDRRDSAIHCATDVASRIGRQCHEVGASIRDRFIGGSEEDTSEWVEDTTPKSTPQAASVSPSERPIPIL